MPKNKRKNKRPTGCFRIVTNGRIYDDWTIYRKTKAFKRMKRKYEEETKSI